MRSWAVQAAVLGLHSCFKPSDWDLRGKCAWLHQAAEAWCPAYKVYWWKDSGWCLRAGSSCRSLNWKRKVVLCLAVLLQCENTLMFASCGVLFLDFLYRSLCKCLRDTCFLERYFITSCGTTLPLSASSNGFLPFQAPNWVFPALLCCCPSQA